MENDNKSVYALGARQGLWAGLYFTAIFFLQVLGSGSVFPALLSNLMIIAVPFILYSLLRRHYRDGGCEGSLSEIWMHGIMIFICGSVILALVSLVFLRYIDPAFIYRESARLVEAYRALGDPTLSSLADALDQARTTHTLPTPVQFAMVFLWLGGFSGSILALVEALIIKFFTHR